MCWTSSYNPIFKVAEEPISVKKILRENNDDILSIFYPFNWKLNQRYHTELGIPSLTENEAKNDSLSDYFYVPLPPWTIEEGFYSCSEIHKVNCSNRSGMTQFVNQYDTPIALFPTSATYNIKIYNCVIPLGAHYYVNEENEYISEDLIIIDEEKY